MNDLDKIEALERNTVALYANTEAMIRLAVVWEKLHAKAVSIQNNPDSPGVKAAGVPLATFPKPVHPLVEAYPPKEFSL